MVFRKLQIEDFPLFTRYFSDNPLNEKKEDLQVRLEEIEDEIHESKFEYFGLIEEDKLIGYGKLRSEQEEAHFIGPFVLPKYRRKGIGRAIITHVEGQCQERGIPRINAYSFIDTKLATEFLTTIGYKLESVSELGVNVYKKEF